MQWESVRSVCLVTRTKSDVPSHTAAFDYQFDLLENANNELGNAYSKLLLVLFCMITYMT
jgi:hypothetical protein